jgi:diacylglycerol kinase (ATP)
VSYENLQKDRRGISRIWHAIGYSVAGIRAAWLETAFRQESIAAIVLFPIAFWIGRNWIEVVLLIGSTLFVIIVEIINTAIEASIDRISGEWHPVSKKAKDLGSAAVLLSLLLCVGIWGAAIYQHF